MVVLRATRQDAADFARDVADPLTLAGEELVLNWLRGFLRRVVCDCRDEHGAFDFQLLKSADATWDVPDKWAMKTLDVKVDKWWDETDNIVFEERHEYDSGLVKPGWGRMPRLDLLGMLAPDSGWLTIVDVPKFRALVDENKDRWKLRGRRNKTYTTLFYTVPTLVCRRHNIIWLMMRLPSLTQEVA